MKKLLLLSSIAVAMSANAADYGTSPETAVDLPASGWQVQDMATAPKEAWFKIKFTTTNGRPGMFPAFNVGSDPNVQQTWIYQCADGTMETPRMFPGAISNIIESGKEYLLKVVPTSEGCYCMGSPTELPESMKGREFFPIDVPASDMGQTRTVEPGATVWYKCDFAYPSMVTTNYMMMPVAGVEKVVVKHQECPGGVNEGNILTPAYNKAGVNVIGVTAAATATAPVQFQIGLNGMAAFSCNNNLSRGQKLELDQETTYPNAYWTVEKVFEAPEDGVYTFINHGAKGTELNIGKAVRGVEDTSYFGNKLSCDFGEGETAIVGEKDAMIVKTLAKGDLVAVQSDAFTTLAEGAPFLKVVKGDATGGIENINDNNTVEIKALGGKSFSISNVLLAAGAKAVVYDMNARKVAEKVIPAGAESQVITLDVPSGLYLIIVYGNNRSASAKIAVE